MSAIYGYTYGLGLRLVPQRLILPINTFLDLIKSYNLQNSTIERKISVKMLGSSEKRICYLYVKNDWKARQYSAQVFLRYELFDDLVTSDGHDGI